MERIKKLNRYQKGLLIVLVAMFVSFTAVYFVICPRKGYEYKNVILKPKQQNGSIVYSGRIKGETAAFTVAQDKTVTFVWGDKTYGPYTAREDATAIPEDDDLADYMKGVEILCGKEVFFRGGVVLTGINGYEMMLFAEDGSDMNIGISYSVNGVEYDENGNIVDDMEPSVWNILELMRGPELTGKGEWMVWLAGAFISVCTAVSVVFADELFRWNLSFIVRSVQDAEPSEWHIATRYISWTMMTVAALIFYIMGLTV